MNSSNGTPQPGFQSAPPQQFQVQPPNGQRAPLGGGVAQPLATGAAPAPLGGAPVPPAQPSWAAPQGAPAQAPRIVDAHGRDVTDQVLMGLQQSAPLAQVQHYFPTATVEQLRALCAAHGLTLNELPPAQPPAQAPPQQAAPAGAAPAPAVKPDEERRGRINKAKDEPKIQQLHTEGRTPEEISAAIDLKLKSVQSAMKRLGLEPRIAPDAVPPQGEQPSAQPLVVTEGPIQVTPPKEPYPEGYVADDELPAPLQEQCAYARGAIDAVQRLALSSGMTFEQIARAAQLLEAVTAA